MIEGVSIKLGEQEYIVPALSLGAIKRLQPIIESLAGVSVKMKPEDVDNIGIVILTALQRNYPDITIEQILEGIDLRNAADTLAAILGASGLKPAGEAIAASAKE